MQLTPDLLDEYLTVLKEHKVPHFSCPAFTVTLSVLVDADDTDPDIAKALARREAVAVERAQRLGNYSHPSLWQGREPPSFPGVDKPDRSPHQDVE